MRLPPGWDNELRALDTQIKDVQKRQNDMRVKMEMELQRVRAAYDLEIIGNDGELSRLRGEKDLALGRIRDGPGVNHPTRVKISNTRQAAEVLAHYWQGEEMDRETLLDGIAGMGIPGIYARASDFAANLTKPESDERKYVQVAQDHLWSK